MRWTARLLPAALLAAPAAAELSFCNDTPVTLSVAIGYATGDTWTSEGWWRIEPVSCTAIIEEDLDLRYYYWHAWHPGGDLVEDDYRFCISDEVFTIEGDTDCADRGHDRVAFNEVNVGEALSFTVHLTGAEPTPEMADAFADTLARLQGRWRDDSEPSFETVIEGRHLTDFYAGVGGARAAFDMVETCKGVAGAGPAMRVVYDGPASQPLCWGLLSLDETTWRFRAAGADAVVTMTRQ